MKKDNMIIGILGTVVFTMSLTAGLLIFCWWIVLMSAIYGIGLFLSISAILNGK